MPDENEFRKIYAWNFRGFEYLEIPLFGTNILVGDNSSGKSSILHLIDCVLRNELEEVPTISEDFGVDRYDYFSNYLKNQDVIIGYEAKNKEDRIAKIVTIKQIKNIRPTVTRCSYFTNGNIVTIKRHGSSNQKRNGLLDVNCKFSELYEFHNINSGFSQAKKHKKGVFPPNSPISLFNSLDEKTLDDGEFLKVLGFPVPSVRHIAPVRNLPERFYDLKRTLSPTGKHFAVMWRDLEAKKENVFKEINRFGSESGLFENIEVSPISKTVVDSPLFVKIQKKGQQFFLNQLGVGISQVVPVLVESVMVATQKHRYLAAFQQPELHLHPVAQAALGTFFYQTLHRKEPLFLETHSNYLIDRFRAEIKNDKVQESDFRILFCESTKKGNTCNVIDVGSDGKLIEPPKTYFKFFISELTRTMF